MFLSKSNSQLCGWLRKKIPVGDSYADDCGHRQGAAEKSTGGRGESGSVGG